MSLNTDTWLVIKLTGFEGFVFLVLNVLKSLKLKYLNLRTRLKSVIVCVTLKVSVRKSRD